MDFWGMLCSRRVPKFPGTDDSVRFCFTDYPCTTGYSWLLLVPVLYRYQKWPLPVTYHWWFLITTHIFSILLTIPTYHQWFSLTHLLLNIPHYFYLLLVILAYSLLSPQWLSHQVIAVIALIPRIGRKPPPSLKAVPRQLPALQFLGWMGPHRWLEASKPI